MLMEMMNKYGRTLNKNENKNSIRTAHNSNLMC